MNVDGLNNNPWDVTQDVKADFLELLRDGLNAAAAAHAVGFTGNAIRKHRRSHTQYYDREFADACAAAENSDERAATQRERIEEAFWAKIDAGYWPAIEKGMYAYHPDFEHLRHTNLRVSGSIDHAVRMLMPHLTDEEIEQRLAEIEAKKGELSLVPDRPQLPPAA